MQHNTPSHHSKENNIVEHCRMFPIVAGAVPKVSPEFRETETRSSNQSVSHESNQELFKSVGENVVVHDRSGGQTAGEYHSILCIEKHRYRIVV
jgi:hypothetical protein